MAYTLLSLQNIAELKTRRGNATFPTAATVSGFDYPTSMSYTYYVWDDASLLTDNSATTATVVQSSVGASNGRWIRIDYNNNITGLKAVALSGSYNDLTNKPSIPSAQVNSDWNATSGVAQLLNKPTLATVATSGSYVDLTNKPTIPSAQVNTDWNSTTGVTQLLNKPVLAAVATSGSYTDLSAQPVIPRATLLYGSSGLVAQPIKIWAQQITPNSASGFTVDISSASFGTIVCVQVTGQQNINTIQGALVSVKTDSNTQLTLNIYRSAVTGVLLLNTSVPGLEFHPSPSSVDLNVLVVGY